MDLLAIYDADTATLQQMLQEVTAFLQSADAQQSSSTTFAEA